MLVGRRLVHGLTRRGLIHGLARGRRGVHGLLRRDIHGLASRGLLAVHRLWGHIHLLRRRLDNLYESLEEATANVRNIQVEQWLWLW